MSMEELEKLSNKILTDYETLLNLIIEIDGYDLLSLKTELSEKALTDIKKLKRQKISLKQYIDKQENLFDEIIEINKKRK